MKYKQGDLICFSHAWKGNPTVEDHVIYEVAKDFDTEKVLVELNLDNPQKEDYVFDTWAEMIARWMQEKGYVQKPTVTRWCVILEKKVEMKFS